MHTWQELNKKLAAVDRQIDIATLKRMPLDRKLARLGREKSRVEQQITKFQQSKAP